MTIVRALVIGRDIARAIRDLVAEVRMLREWLQGPLTVDSPGEVTSVVNVRETSRSTVPMTWDDYEAAESEAYVPRRNYPK